MTPPTYLPITACDANHIDSLVEIINSWAEKKGWNEDLTGMTAQAYFNHKAAKLALIHSEVSECLEFLRTKIGALEPTRHFDTQGSPLAPDDKVPSLSGEAAELADTLIRILHYAGEFNVPLGDALRLKHEYNITRPVKHGKNF